MSSKREITIDPKTYDLAVHCLTPGTPAAMKHELAEWIQRHIELWMYDDREGALEAAMELGE